MASRLICYTGSVELDIVDKVGGGVAKQRQRCLDDFVAMNEAMNRGDLSDAEKYSKRLTYALRGLREEIRPYVVAVKVAEDAEAKGVSWQEAWREKSSVAGGAGVGQHRSDAA
jgi:hypothetical protein